MKPELIDFINIPEILPEHPVISIAGAGGKTTLMFSLAENLPGTTITTTTTKVGETQILSADQQLSSASFPPLNPEKIIWVSPSLQPLNGKITGCSETEFEQIAKICKTKNWTLIAETDGAARRHIKAPADHEPNIPAICNVCFYLVGLDVLDRPINSEYVHRPEIFSTLTNIKPNDTITVNAIISLLEHPGGGLKNTPADALRIAYLTHADSNERIKAAEMISKQLHHYDFVCIN